ncbi:MAG: hypothetical protein IJV59_05500 [Eubacterium sp.]|nr:hypothetical protein [Eubacterium sp.]
MPYEPYQNNDQNDRFGQDPNNRFNQDPNNNNNNNNWNPMQQGAPRTPAQQFAMASITFAILGLVTFFLLVTPICFGSLAIIFGLLSRGQNRRVSRPASIAIPLGTAAIILGIGLFVIGIITIITQFGSFENYINLIQQQVLSYENGTAGTLDMSQLMENFGGQ